MAEFGAHLTAISSEDCEAPSIFDVLAQEGLLSSLQPALKYASKILVERFPAQLAFAHCYSDELFAVFHTILETYYLRHYGGTFAENFYGLKRVFLTSKRNFLRLLLCVIGIPYLKSKLDSMYERIRDGSLTVKDKQTVTLVQGFCAVYPYLHMFWESGNFLLQFLFVIGKSRWHSLSLWLSGTMLKYLEREDYLKHQQLQQSLFNLRNGVGLKSLLTRLGGILAYGASFGLSSSVFFLQFLDWWYTSDVKVTSLTALPIPPPPLPCEDDLKTVPSDRDVCPICLLKRTNDTALAVSGYVFCYPCIHRYVQSNQACPITRYPARLEHLVKIYSFG